MGQRLHGRSGELELLQEIIAAVQGGDSQVLVLRGEAGIGKTALLERLVEQAAAFHVLQVAGVESDMELAYAGLQQLCSPLIAHVDELPAPQRDALDVAFGRGAGPTPDRFMVGLAVLSLLAAESSRRPLLCVVDDAQWLDEVSLQTLAFVARRLLAEPVGLLFAARTGTAPEVLPGLPELIVDGLSDTDAGDLLGSVVVGRLDPRVRDRIVAETRGVPLALIHVPHNVSPEELAGGFGEPVTRRSAGQMEESFARRIAGLPSETRQLLLVAAAEPVGDASLFMRTAAELGVPFDALAPAESAGVIEFGSRMRFQHPLMRSAAYRIAEPDERRRVHRALAAAIDPVRDPDRRAWHAAHGASGHDDAVADELENSAGRAHARGGMAAAAAFLERATALTSEPSRRSARALAAAKAKRDASAPTAAHEHLTIAELGPLTGLQQAQVTHLRAQMEFARARGGEVNAPNVGQAAAQLLSAAEQLEVVDGDLSRECYLEAMVAAMYAGRLGDPDLLKGVAAKARAAVGRLPESTRPTDRLLKGWAMRITDGVGGADANALPTALDLICRHAERTVGQPPDWMPLGLAIVLESAAAEIWDDEVYHRLASVAVRRARDAGALAVLPPALVYRAGVHVQAGEFSSAAALIDEANAIAGATGYTPLKYHALSLSVWRGTPAVALALIEAANADGRARGEGRVLGATACLAAILYNGLGRYEDALAAAAEACTYRDVGFHSWALIELVEAAVHAGERETAQGAVARLAEHAGASGTDWGLGTLARARALLASADEAEALFDEAITRLSRTRITVHEARARLVYGEWLRRLNRRNDARRHLGEARQMFVRMGAQAFAERARRELTAAGEKVGKQAVAEGAQLTSQEAQIARLAANGLTNQEIGSQLFISTHTVEWHLRKVFAKLGITSRRQLRTVAWPD